MSPPVLVVEDDAVISSIVSGYLESEGFQVEVAGTGRELLRRIATNAYGVVLLDLGLPDEDGLPLLRKLVSRTPTPVMVVTGRRDLETRLTAFEIGAADVLTKPFDPRELRYRVINLLGRGRTAARREVFHFGRWRMDTAARTLVSIADGHNCPLTRIEFDLLTLLLRNPGRVFSRQQILDAITGQDEPESERAVDIVVSRLRRKLRVDRNRGDRLVTVRGIGYRLDLDEASHRAPRRSKA